MDGNIKKLRYLLLISLLVVANVVALSAQSDTLSVDTTGWRYRIGYQIGSWLPFLIIFGLALAIIIRSYRLSRRDQPCEGSDAWQERL